MLIYPWVLMPLRSPPVFKGVLLPVPPQALIAILGRECTLKVISPMGGWVALAEGAHSTPGFLFSSINTVTEDKSFGVEQI